MAEYNLLEERVLQFGNQPQDFLPDTTLNETAEDRLEMITKALSDREKFCFSQNQTWNFNVQVMGYIGSTVTRQLSRVALSRSQRSSLEYLRDMAIHFVDSEDMTSSIDILDLDIASWRNASRVIGSLLNDKFGEVLFDALSSLEHSASYSVSNYESGLKMIKDLRTQRADFFQWEALRALIPAPTVVPEELISDHNEQRRLYGISTYDMDNPKSFICWITIQCALFFCHENQNSVPSRYNFATAEQEWRADLIEFIHALYIFGFKPEQLDDPEESLVRTQLSNYYTYMKTMSD